MSSTAVRPSCPAKETGTWFPPLSEFFPGRVALAKGVLELRFHTSFPDTTQAMSHSSRSGLALASYEHIKGLGSVDFINLFPATTREGVDLFTPFFLTLLSLKPA